MVARAHLQLVRQPVPRTGHRTDGGDAAAVRAVRGRLRAGSRQPDLEGSNMPDIQLPGIRLYYEERGSGTPILLINGTTGFTEVWGAATEELARLGRTIAYDRRGCSRSERPAPYETTSVRQQSDDAAALLGGLNASPAVVIGRSYGGGVAVDLAMRYPQHVKTLVLLEPALIGLSEETTRYFADLFRDVLGDAERNGTMYASES